MSTFAKHLADVKSGEITKSNVIGIRKAMNAYDLKARRYSISRTCPEWTGSQVTGIERALDQHKPRVAGELHETGLALLRSPRYRKRLASVAEIIAGLEHFRLVRFDRLGSNGVHSVPVYQVWCKIPPKGDALDGGTYQAFTFRNIPWQSGGNGPEIEGKDF